MSANIIKKPFFAWPLLVIAVIAVSSAGAVLQEMSVIPPFLRASWRMYATSIVLLPGLFFQWTNKELENDMVDEDHLYLNNKYILSIYKNESDSDKVKQQFNDHTNLAQFDRQQISYEISQYILKNVPSYTSISSNTYFPLASLRIDVISSGRENL